MALTTGYIGKTAVFAHFCRCDGCGRFTVLNSYTTTRFITLFNIPLLPMGRYRVSEECSHCSHRTAIRARMHGRERQRNLDLIVEGFASDAENPKSCAHALQTLMVYDEEIWFNDMRKTHGLRFENDMDIQHLIARGLCRFGRYDEAMLYCRKALVLGAGEQAEELLAYCQKLSEASEEPDDLEALEAQPEPVAQAYIPLATLTATAAVILVVAFISSLRNFNAWIVNGTLHPYTFTIDDQPYTLEAETARSITLRLGEHQLHAADAPPYRFEYDIPLIRQWLGRNLVVINPDSMALLAVAENPKDTRNSPTTYSHSGQIRIFPGLANPLHGLQRISPNATRTASISFYRPDSHMAMIALMMQLELEEAAAAYARRVLRMNPANVESADLLTVALTDIDDEETLALLRIGTGSSPLLLPWHLCYQDYVQANHPEHDLEREYTLVCQQHPEDPVGYYLLGRVVEDRKAAYSLLEYADRDYGMGGVALYAIARNLYLRGEFKEALPYAQRALQHAPDHTELISLSENILLALRDYDTLLTDMLTTLEKKQIQKLDEKRVLYLTQAGYHLEAEQEIARQADRQLRLNAVRFYAVGNINDYLDCMAGMDDPHTAMEKLLHHERIDESDHLISQKEDHPYWEHLVLYCAAMHRGNEEVAQRNLIKAIQETDPDIPSHVELARMLSEEGGPSLELILNLDLPAPEKAILCSAIYHRYPDAAYFKELASVYNFTPAYPQLLLKKWLRECEH